MDVKTEKTLKRRIASAAGHLKGIERMVDDNAYCIDIIQQVQAVQAALNKINSLLLDNHLKTCVTTAIQGDDPAQREQMLNELSAVFTAKSKL
jgi:DNA-binding FrmR family transcriptional regulator